MSSHLSADLWVRPTPGHMPISGTNGIEPDQLWARHGTTLYSLACAMTGRHADAHRAITAGMTSYLRRARDRPGPESAEAIHTLAPFVWRGHQRRIQDQARCRVVHRLPPLMDRLRELALLQRTSIALWDFGGLSRRELADLLGQSPAAIGALPRSGLRDLDDTTALASASPGL
jgi:DNA-directed RNA polymerase specialized sigma24 family protein